MASTYSIADALSIANRSMSRAIEADHASYISNSALNEIWHAYDWRVSITSLPPFWLIPLVQDYGAPFYAVPLDFFGLRQAYLVQTTSSPTVRRNEIKVIKNIRKEYARGLPHDIGYVPESKSLRVYPQIPENIASSAFLIDGTYKKLAPQTTSQTLQSTPVPWDDIYINIFVSALRWAAADTSDSPTKITKYQEMRAAIDSMANAEGLELGNQVTAPAEGLLGENETGSYWPGSGIF